MPFDLFIPLTLVLHKELRWLWVDIRKTVIWAEIHGKLISWVKVHILGMLIGTGTSIHSQLPSSCMMLSIRGTNRVISPSPQPLSHSSRIYHLPSQPAPMHRP